MGMKLRVGHAINGTRRRVDEFSSDHVACGAVAILPAPPNAGFHLCFHFKHGLASSFTKCLKHVGIFGQAIKQRYGFGNRESKIIPDGTLNAGSYCKRLICFGMQVIAKTLERLLAHRTGKTKSLRTLATLRREVKIGLK